MKDVPHHIKKLNRRVVRSLHRSELQEEAEALTSMPHPKKQTARQMKLQSKEMRRRTKNAHIPTPASVDENNKKMRNRTPIFQRRSHRAP